jgi:hypothetical protein
MRKEKKAKLTRERQRDREKQREREGVCVCEREREGTSVVWCMSACRLCVCDVFAVSHISRCAVTLTSPSVTHVIVCARCVTSIAHVRDDGRRKRGREGFCAHTHNEGENKEE